MAREKKRHPAEFDRDPSWEALVDLMRESDKPSHPTEARYAQMLRSIKAEAFPAAVVRPVADETFGGWMRTVFFGGGPAAQVLRMAAVGALVWVAASDFAGGDRPNVPARETTVASAAGGTRIAVANGDAGFADAAPRSGDGVVVPASVAVAPPDLSAAWFEASSPAFADSVYPVSNSQVGFGLAGSRSSAAMASRGDEAPLQDLVNQIQQLKFQSYVEQDREVLDRVQRIESSVARLMERDESLSPDSVAAIETFQRAEQLLAGRRYADALVAFREVRRLSPGTFLAFLAQYQIAGISFVNTRDYEGALEAYNKALKEYPAHFMSNEHNTHIRQRIEMLTQNRANAWRAVDLWQDARMASPETRVTLLREILFSYPESPLSADAAQSLLEATESGGAKPGSIQPTELISLCETAVDSAQDTNHAATLQFVKAETIFRRLFDLERADAEFRKALTMPGADAIADKAQLRLNQIAQRGRPSDDRSRVESNARPS